MHKNIVSIIVTVQWEVQQPQLTIVLLQCRIRAQTPHSVSAQLHATATYDNWVRLMSLGNRYAHYTWNQPGYNVRSRNETDPLHNSASQLNTIIQLF